jgi:hypothetical protein
LYYSNGVLLFPEKEAKSVSSARLNYSRFIDLTHREVVPGILVLEPENLTLITQEQVSSGRLKKKEPKTLALRG